MRSHARLPRWGAEVDDDQVADQLRTTIALLVVVGTLMLLGLHTSRWRAGRASGTELLGHTGFSLVLLGTSAALLTGVV